LGTGTSPQKRGEPGGVPGGGEKRYARGGVDLNVDAF